MSDAEGVRNATSGSLTDKLTRDHRMTLDEAHLILNLKQGESMEQVLKVWVGRQPFGVADRCAELRAFIRGECTSGRGNGNATAGWVCTKELALLAVKGCTGARAYRGRDETGIAQAGRLISPAS